MPEKPKKGSAKNKNKRIAKRAKPKPLLKGKPQQHGLITKKRKRPRNTVL